MARTAQERTKAKTIVNEGGSFLEVEQVSIFRKLGLDFLEEVQTPNGAGLVQGILDNREKDPANPFLVIVSHRPTDLPMEFVPRPQFWKLIYYPPAAIRRLEPEKRKHYAARNR